MIEILMKPGVSISGSNSNLFIKVRASLSVAFFLLKLKAKRRNQTRQHRKKRNERRSQTLDSRTLFAQPFRCLVKLESNREAQTEASRSAYRKMS